MTLDTIVTPTCEFVCEITGAGVINPGQRLRVTRVFDTSAGPRVAVACAETGRPMSWQVPLGWVREVVG